VQLGTAGLLAGRVSVGLGDGVAADGLADGLGEAVKVGSGGAAV
jgi:hypothetical protein